MLFLFFIRILLFQSSSILWSHPLTPAKNNPGFLALGHENMPVQASILHGPGVGTAQTLYFV